MTTRTFALLMAIALAGFGHAGEARATSSSQQKKNDQKAEPSVAGRWTVAVKGSPHGDVTMGLNLAQEGKKISGTLATPHGDDLQVEGEFVGGTLTIATPGGGDSRISLTAKLKDNGTLEGYLSSEMGDMTWTATRTAGK